MVESRERFLDRLFRDLGIRGHLRTALDAGCGTGFFSNYLSRLGFEVTGFDARVSNVLEARTRCPEATFFVGDVEDTGIRARGPFDLVLCFGLLYHLENPAAATRNLFVLTGHVLMIESLTTPSRLPVATLMTENPGEDQGLRPFAFVPSEACLVKMLYGVGFSAVYKTAPKPDHEDFRDTVLSRRRRTILVASKGPLASPLLRLAAEPQRRRPDMWRRSVTAPIREVASAIRVVRQWLGF